MPNYKNPTTSKNVVVPSWYGPILSKNTYLGQPLSATDPNAQPRLSTPGQIFPSPNSYRDVIYSSLSMLFGTRVGERLWLSSYGLNMDTLVFELLDATTMQAAQATIRSGIANWEPRVSVLQVNAFPLANSNQVTFQIVLQVVGAPPDDVFTYSVAHTPST